MVSPVMPTYGRYELTLVRGEGVYVFNEDGKKFLDFGAGIAVNSVGHCHPHLVKSFEKTGRKFLALFKFV